MAHLTLLHPSSSSPDGDDRSAGGASPSRDDAPHILVKNNEQLLFDLFQELLEEEGYRVSTSIYMLDLEKVRKLAPDLMVLDIMFEGSSKGWPFITWPGWTANSARC